MWVVFSGSQRGRDCELLCRFRPPMSCLTISKFQLGAPEGRGEKTRRRRHRKKTARCLYLLDVQNSVRRLQQSIRTHSHCIDSPKSMLSNGHSSHQCKKVFFATQMRENVKQRTKNPNKEGKIKWPQSTNAPPKKMHSKRVKKSICRAFINVHAKMCGFWYEEDLRLEILKPTFKLCACWERVRKISCFPYAHRNALPFRRCATVSLTAWCRSCGTTYPL